ncbi:hypothetical protein TSARBOMBA_244 [Bacillus phage TsarBomba]|uniref:Uncharacterized protein n=1 Tax=Bacillus phage TsarBomba TaxID=1690456 RepID=A0A0K2CZX1_9CAUD|nr:hypothetical protein TSARBOMBA_244 [Bacillus phage TsarBomba]ALA13114.1 hypothetical protein TSARBOMBA_244 [Bacillus phage TsarBomba]
MAATTIDFVQTFKTIGVKIGDVFLYNGHYYEVSQINSVDRALHGLQVKGKGRRIVSPFETKDDAKLLTSAF